MTKDFRVLRQLDMEDNTFHGQNPITLEPCKILVVLHPNSFVMQRLRGGQEQGTNTPHVLGSKPVFFPVYNRTAPTGFHFPEWGEGGSLLSMGHMCKGVCGVCAIPPALGIAQFRDDPLRVGA